MMSSLVDLFRAQKVEPSPEGIEFLTELEATVAVDLWKSAGGHWSRESMMRIRELAMEKLAGMSPGVTREDYRRAWLEVIRDFHHNHQWGEKRLAKKEKKAPTKESKIFWEMAPYVWAFIQSTIIMKFFVLYFGIRAADEVNEPVSPVYLAFAIFVSFGSLGWFAYRRFSKDAHKG